VGLAKSHEVRSSLRLKAFIRTCQRWLRRSRLFEEPDSGPRVNHEVVYGVLVALALGLYLTRGAWGPLPPAGEDVMGHLARAEYGTSEILGRGHIDGWFPRFMVGHQMFLLNGPGFTWLIALTRTLSFGLLSLEGAFKVVTMVSYLAVPIAAAFLASSMGFRRRAVGITAILALAVSTTFGIGLEGLFVTGLVPHQVGAVIFCAGLGCLIRVVSEQGRTRYVVLSGILIAALLITHLRSALILAVFFVLYLVVRMKSLMTRQIITGLLASGAIAGAVSAFWLLPFLAHADLRGPFTGFGETTLGQRVGSILRGEVLFRPRVGLLILVSICIVTLAALFVDRRLLPLTLVPVSFFVLSYALLDIETNEVTIQLADRGLGYVGLLAVLPTSLVISAATHPLRRIGLAASLLMSSALVLVPLGHHGDLAQDFPRAVPAMSAAAERLRQLVPETGRFVVQRDFPGEIERTGVIHPETWLARESRRNTLNVFNPEASPSEAGFEAEEFGSKPVNQSAQALAHLGVSHVVATSATFSQELETSSRYTRVWEQLPVSIFRLDSLPVQPDTSLLMGAGRQSLEASVRGGNIESLRIRYRAPSDTHAVVALSWSPKWQATVDGDPRPLSRTKLSLLSLDLPAGEHDLNLEFRADIWDLLGRGISALTLLGVLTVGLLSWRRPNLMRRFARAREPLSGTNRADSSWIR
jgi:hypothetical protein